MRTLGIILLSTSITVAGCGPVALRVETPDAASAHLHTQVVKGDEPTEPSDCFTPCVLKLPRGTEHQFEIDAPGYYPASFKVSYDNVRIIERREDDVLRVPLLPRPPAGNGNQ